ncbi:nucleotidyltransferase family protein [Pseudomonas sp. PDM14]|uniref:nucleotidyltransferase family protein n=1 Tax=Pseudomonas sp. PDM14 TaxID=2769288 RepID=UPI0017827EA7|nr:nucleotidyltransferase family protein [Pseudomonas sp. PDM14]MBD9485352.1 nucleotidyltransferase family protein [Pseudomonas sp. PDM14]
MPARDDLHPQLIHLAQQSAWLMEALHAARSLQLASWCIGAGAVRNLVWDHLHQRPAQVPGDIDLVYFDPSAQAEQDENLRERLATCCPELPWEVTNQAHVHHWYANYFGQPMAPLNSLEEAVGSWPEYATTVGLYLDADDRLQVIAPHGLDDLFALRVRHNPTRVGVAIYNQRLAQKRYQERWPRVQIIPA